MFGLNKKVGKSFFKTAKPDELFITSRFFTLQGEGPFRGHPAYFIRLAKCNLACSFCDTYFDTGEWRSFNSLLEEANSVIAAFFQSRNLPTPSWAKGLEKKMILVITGGEPSLQQNLSAFLEEAKPYFQYIQIESNGISLLPDLPQNTTLVVSPKCLEKDAKAIRYLKPNAKMLERADCLKFVMSAPEEDRYVPYSEIPAWAHEWAEKTNKQVFVSPMNKYRKEPQRVNAIRDEGQELTLAERSEINEVVSFWEAGLLDMEKNQRNHEYAAEYCMKYGFILNLQIHLFASLP
ncbi:7-carboxy-7-deazaguanine synthase QueE [Legionella parisiensis]|uniref:7-carboxy-7-deazaguanine synthase n=1 Tax=Legionella parisiensis TaxID=45071 RepID=A0A1E5JQ59_9GAMM|nr:7-carboxy-7-deazaguanine synthase QueE [Legionella parisiensis]KTD42205.1 radical activating enzyme [Legionella parisiensis]OEH46178.1 7-carboxy-7-deazaguanine synthase [Legionella parisiensis]STX72396.1 Organic radical activating enzyme [Legionella parisiensis]